MVETREIISVTAGAVGQTKIWTVEFRKADGTKGCHVFPENTLLWRSIEYGIDINDVDTLLDVILHEPFIADPADPANHAADPAALRGHTVAAPGTVDPIFGVMARPAAQVPVWLYNAPDVGTARQAHLIRVEHCKRTKAAYSTHAGRDADPLEVIRGQHREVIALIEQVPEVAAVHEGMRAHIRATRERMRQEGREPWAPQPRAWETGQGRRR